MSQQYNKVEKRKRLKRYKERQREKIRENIRKATSQKSRT